MFESKQQMLTLCDSTGAPRKRIRACLAYTAYFTREGEYGRENGFYYTAITREPVIEEGMLLFDGVHRYRILSVARAGAETVLRLTRRVIFTNPASDGGELEFIYRAVRERAGVDLMAGREGVQLTASVTSREEGILAAEGELIARGKTLGEAQAEILSVLGVLFALAEDEASPLLSVSRGAFRYRRDENGFTAKEILNICVKEEPHV